MFASRTGATRRILHAYQSTFWLTMYMLGGFQDNQLTASAAFAFIHYLLVLCTSLNSGSGPLAGLLP